MKYVLASSIHATHSSKWRHRWQCLRQVNFHKLSLVRSSMDLFLFPSLIIGVHIIDWEYRSKNDRTEYFTDGICEFQKIYLDMLFWMNVEFVIYKFPSANIECKGLRIVMCVLIELAGSSRCDSAYFRSCYRYSISHDFRIVGLRPSSLAFWTFDNKFASLDRTEER